VNNLALRSLTGAGFVVIMLGSAILGQFVFSILFFLVMILALREYLVLTGSAGDILSNSSVFIIASVLYLTLALNAAGLVKASIILINLPALFILFIAELWKKQSEPFRNIGNNLTAIVYISLPLGLSLYFFDPAISSGIGHFGLMIGYLLILWLNDTAAYLVGSAIGKHRLFERISPKKCWEGSIGGGVFALLTAYLMSLLFEQYETWQWITMAIIIVISGTLGDLVESLLKRSLQVKDSGTLLPGHGGMLDRFDAVFISVPFVFVFLTLFCQ
jgi:phosphatidate cytidylyltransferase